MKEKNIDIDKECQKIRMMVNLGKDVSEKKIIELVKNDISKMIDYIDIEYFKKSYVDVGLNELLGLPRTYTENPNYMSRLKLIDQYNIQGLHFVFERSKNQFFYNEKYNRVRMFLFCEVYDDDGIKRSKNMMFENKIIGTDKFSKLIINELLVSSNMNMEFIKKILSMKDIQEFIKYKNLDNFKLNHEETFYSIKDLFSGKLDNVKINYREY